MSTQLDSQTRCVQEKKRNVETWRKVPDLHADISDVRKEVIRNAVAEVLVLH